MKRLESLVMEKTTATKRLELQLNKTAIELGTRSSHLENLLVEDKEVCLHVVILLFIFVCCFYQDKKGNQRFKV